MSPPVVATARRVLLVVIPALLVARVFILVDPATFARSEVPALNGMLGIAHGLVAVWLLTRARSKIAVLVAGWMTGQLLHWGAGPELLPVPMQAPAWLGYFVLSMAGESALVHGIALIWSDRPALGRRLRFAIYAAPALALIVAAGWIVSPADHPFAGALQVAFFLLHAVHVNLAPLASLLLIGLAFRAAPADSTRRWYLRLALLGGVAGLAPYAGLSILEAAGIGTPFGIAADSTVALFALTAVTLGVAVAGLERRRAA